MDDNTIKLIASKVTRELLENSTSMEQCMLIDIVEALERGEDVDDGLANMILTRPFMEKFIDELLKYEEE